jgi:hypothetical protein
MEKKARVTKITKMDKLDNYGNTSFIIEFDNADKGYYNSKNANQTKFVVGNVADYSIEEKQGSKGVYYKITTPQEPGAFKGSGRPQVEPRIQMISFSMSYCKDLIVAGKVPMSDLEKEFNRIYTVMISKI